MDNREKIKIIIKKDFNKKNNYKQIINKIDKKDNRSFYKYAFTPLVLIIAIAITIVITNNKKIEKKKENNVIENTPIGNNNTDNNIIINSFSNTSSSSNDIDGKIKNGIYIPYFEVLSDINIPKDFDNNGNADTVWVKSDPNSNEYDILNNYNFYYRNTSNNRIIIISLSDKFKPLRCPSDYVLNYPKSVVNGHEVLIIKNQNRFLSIFSYKGYNFDIESYDISEEEFINLLSSIIK